MVYLKVIGMNKYDITPSLDEEHINVFTKELDAFWSLFNE